MSVTILCHIELLQCPLVACCNIVRRANMYVFVDCNNGYRHNGCVTMVVSVTVSWLLITDSGHNCRFFSFENQKTQQ